MTNKSCFIVMSTTKINTITLRPEQQLLFEQVAAKMSLTPSHREIIAKQIQHLADLASYNLGIKNPLQKEVVQADDLAPLVDEIAKMTLAIGNPYPLDEFLTLEEKPASMLKFLLAAKMPPLSEIFGWAEVRAMVYEKDFTLINETRNQLCRILLKLYEKIKDLPASDPHHLVYESNVAYLLSIYSILAPETNPRIEVPQLIEGKWRLCTYHVEKIALTPDYLGSQIFAYGMKGTYRDDGDQEKKAPPYFQFKSTTYPMDDGAFLSILADFNPFATMGEYVFWMGKERIHEWLEKATQGGPKARVGGMSLGGALAQILEATYPHHLESVHAHNPPALRHGLIRPAPADPRIRVIWQQNDMIPYLGGKFKESAEVIAIVGEERRNSAFSHSKAFVAEAEMVMVKLNVNKVNEDPWRKVADTVYSAISIPLFCALTATFICYNLF
jgi:hypothetical protein